VARRTSPRPATTRGDCKGQALPECDSGRAVNNTEMIRTRAQQRRMRTLQPVQLHLRQVLKPAMQRVHFSNKMPALRSLV
jgi:hypothetical protein